MGCSFKEPDKSTRIFCESYGSQKKCFFKRSCLYESLTERFFICFLGMKWVEYSYTSQWSGDHIAERPIVGLTISNGVETFPCTGLVDSGCDTTLLDAEIADFLGIDRSKCKKIKVSGIADDGIDSFIAPVTICVEGYDKYPLSFNVIFVPHMRFGALLGQNDFFKKFKIRFEAQKHKFCFSK